MIARRLALLALFVALPAHAQVTSSDLPGGEDVSATNAASNGAWTRLLAGLPAGDSVPSGRMLHTAIHDPGGDRLIAFGGLQFSQAFQEVWAASLADGQWTPLAVSGTPPAGRRDHIAVFDSQRNRMVIYGGSPADNDYDTDTWALSLGASPAWSQVQTVNTPAGRFSHAGIYDPVRDRMIVFGGYKGSFTNETWALSFATNTWSAIAPVGDVPSNRNAMSAIYDPVRDRMLVFGGWTGSVFDNRVWALSLSGTPTWSQVATLGTPPSGRRHYGAAYDATGDRLLILGGFDASLNYRNDAWALSLSGTPTWSLLSPLGTPPTPRNGHRAVFDPARNRVVEFGGYDGEYQSDLWALSLGATPSWSKLVFSGDVLASPGGLRDHVAVFDAARGRMLVFGGSRFYDSYSNETYALSLGATPVWTRLNLPGVRPAGRFSHTGVYDPVRDRFVVFGGYAGQFRNDVWALNLGPNQNWELLVPAGVAPVPRDALTTVYDPARDRLLLVGGFQGPTTFLGDVWELTFSPTLAWHAITPSGTPPSPRRHYAAAWDAAGDRLVLTGGRDAAGYLDDTWTLEFDGAGNATWVQQRPRGPSPSRRDGHRAVLDAPNNRILVYGGYDGGYRNDLWELSLKGKMAWHLLRSGPRDPEPTPSLLGSFVVDATNERFVQFGGIDISHANGDVWSFSFDQVGQSVRTETVSVPQREHGLILRSVSASGAVEFTLPDGRPAEVALYSISGRRIDRREVGSMGAGPHSVALSGGDRLPAGVYLVRLTNGAETRTSKVVLGLAP